MAEIHEERFPYIQPVVRQMAERLAEQVLEAVRTGGEPPAQWVRCPNVEYPTKIERLEVDHENEEAQTDAIAAGVVKHPPDVIFLVSLAMGTDLSDEPSDDPIIRQGIIVIVAERGCWPTSLIVGQDESVVDGSWMQVHTGPIGRRVWEAMAGDFVAMAGTMDTTSIATTCERGHSVLAMLPARTLAAFVATGHLLDELRPQYKYPDRCCHLATALAEMVIAGHLRDNKQSGGGTYVVRAMGDNSFSIVPADPIFRR